MKFYFECTGFSASKIGTTPPSNLFLLYDTVTQALRHYYDKKKTSDIFTLWPGLNFAATESLF